MKEFDLRRAKLFDLLPDNSLTLVFAGVAKIRSEDEFYPFHANRNFFYLTGIEQENSVLMLVKCPGERKEYLFLDEHNELKERWTGKRLSFEQASEISQITNVYSNNNFEAMLQMGLSKENNVYGNISHLYLDLSDELKIKNGVSTQIYKKELEEKYPHLTFSNVYPLIVELRLVKSDIEIAEMTEAINCTSLGINELLNNMHIGVSEHELSDRFEFFGKTHGRHELAFETIVGSGVNSTTLHHPITQQDKLLEFDDVVLFDLGYKHHGYSADISRTFPVSGTFSAKQKEIYEAVLACNKAVISYAKPGLTLKDLQQFTIDFLKGECIKRKLISKEDDIMKYYIHNVSHFLGLDTHDVGDRTRPLVPGNVITVEPGLYFVEDKIGVRIEDDVLITEDGAVCLSKGIKKELADIEKMLKGRK